MVQLNIYLWAETMCWYSPEHKEGEELFRGADAGEELRVRGGERGRDGRLDPHA